MTAQKRMTTSNWDLYDTRHVVYQPQGHHAGGAEDRLRLGVSGVLSWGNIVTAARAHQSSKHSLKHLAYSAGWKKFEPAWDFVIRLKQLSQMRPMLEAVLSPVAGPSTRSVETRSLATAGKTPGLKTGRHEVRSSVPESA